MSSEHAQPRDIAIPADFVDRVMPRGSRRLGLVVGINAYQDQRIPKLAAAVADARSIHSLMIDPRCGLFHASDTTLLLDGQATERTLRQQLERLAQTATDLDEVWIYFAGHGIVHGGEHRLVPVDVDQSYLDATSVKFGEFSAKIRCRRKIIFLDCCHSGAYSAATRRVHSVEEVFKAYDGAGTVVFCSSDGNEQSVELTDLGRGAFSYWLERGLRGEADSDADGVVTSGELWDFVRRQVERETLARTQLRQTPRIKQDTIGAFALTVSTTSSKSPGPTPSTHQPSRPRVPASSPMSEILALPQLLRHALNADELERFIRLLARPLRSAEVTKLQRAARIASEETSDALLDAANIVRSVLAPLPKRVESQGANEPRVPDESESSYLQSAPFDLVFEKAQAGSAHAQYRLAENYRLGNFVTADLTEAARWYTSAAEQAHAASMYVLGEMHRLGLGVERNAVEAARWYLKAAQQGQHFAELRLGQAYLVGEGVTQDGRMAASWIRKACEADQPAAYFAFSHCCSTGVGVAVDHERAFRWLLKACAEGDARGWARDGFVKGDQVAGWGEATNFKGMRILAWRTLGMHYLQGIGTERDEALGAAWLKRASEEGDGESARTLYGEQPGCVSMLAAFGGASSCWLVCCLLALELFKPEPSSLAEKVFWGGWFTSGLLAAFLAPSIIAYRRGRLGRMAEARSKEPLLPKP